MGTRHLDEMLNYASKLRITDSEKAPVPLLLAHFLPSIQPHYELNPLRKALVHTTVFCQQPVSHLSTRLLPSIPTPLPPGTKARYALHLSRCS